MHGDVRDSVYSRRLLVVENSPLATAGSLVAHGVSQPPQGNAMESSGVTGNLGGAAPERDSAQNLAS